MILTVHGFIIWPIGTILLMKRKGLSRQAKFLWSAASNSGNCQLVNQGSFLLGPHGRQVALHRRGYLGKGHLAYLLWSGSLRKSATQQLISILFFLQPGWVVTVLWTLSLITEGFWQSMPLLQTSVSSEGLELILTALPLCDCILRDLECD